MLLFSIFLLSAIFTFCGLRAPLLQKYFTRGPQREGVVLVGAVLLASLIGWFAFNTIQSRANSHHRFASDGLYLLLLAGVLYGLAALRRRAQAPLWISDLFVVAAAFVSLWLSGKTTVHVLSTAVLENPIGLHQWAIPLTVFWMWIIARMTAALNRTPHVTGGYLGVVALALLFLMKLEWTRNPPFFPVEAAAALAGAGLASVPIALKNREFNIGWSASLALGFLLAQIATIGLVKNAAFFMLLLSFIAFGLPLLDVSFFRMRAALRGEELDIDEQRLRLHEALLHRGVAPAKITMLYLIGGAWMCGLGVLMARYVFGSEAAWWVLLARAALVIALFLFGFTVFFSLARVWMKRGRDEIVPEEIEAFGVRISPVSMVEALDKIEEFIKSQTPHHVVTSDANAILRAQEDEEYSGIIRRAALITPDGFGVVWGARLLNLPVYERVTGVDMVTGICERAAKNDYSIYILGSEEGIASLAAANLQKTYPGLKVAGTHHGMILRNPELENEVIEQIRELHPDVLFVAMGIPAQEKFIAKHFERLNVPVCLGVGGSFDVYAGKYKRAPEAIQRMGMEWIYRVWIDPSRWKRMGYVPRFMAFALRTWIFGSRRRMKD